MKYYLRIKDTHDILAYGPLHFNDEKELKDLLIEMKEYNKISGDIAFGKADLKHYKHKDDKEILQAIGTGRGYDKKTGKELYDKWGYAIQKQGYVLSFDLVIVKHDHDKEVPDNPHKLKILSETEIENYAQMDKLDLELIITEKYDTYDFPSLGTDMSPTLDKLSVL